MTEYGIFKDDKCEFIVQFATKSQTESRGAVVYAKGVDYEIGQYDDDWERSEFKSISEEEVNEKISSATNPPEQTVVEAPTPVAEGIEVDGVFIPLTVVPDEPTALVEGDVIVAKNLDYPTAEDVDSADAFVTAMTGVPTSEFKTRVVTTPKLTLQNAGTCDQEEFAKHLHEVLNGVNELLLEKNRKYGNSVLNPKRIFSRASPLEQINVRIDDKLSRLANQQADDDEDAGLDLLGYLIIREIAKRVQKGIPV